MGCGIQQTGVAAHLRPLDDVNVKRLQELSLPHMDTLSTSLSSNAAEKGASRQAGPWRSFFRSVYRSKIFVVEPALALHYLAGYMYVQSLLEHYIFHHFGLTALRNTSFSLDYDSFDNGSSFCITSDILANFTGDQDAYKEVESRSNHLVAYCMLASLIPSVIVTILFGPLMDRFGRKIGLITPAMGGVLRGIVSVFLIKNRVNPYYFVLLNFISGMFGDITILKTATFAYVSDISSLRWRSLRIGFTQSAISIGASIGQFFGGLWVNRTDCNYVPPLWFYVACNMLIIVYVCVLVPETLTCSKRKEIRSSSKSDNDDDDDDEVKCTCIMEYVKGFRLFFGGMSLLPTWNLWVSLLAVTVILINFDGSLILMIFFLISPPFYFSSLEIGIFQSLRSLSQGLSNLLFSVALGSLGVPDRWLILIGYLFHSVCCILLGFSRNAWQVYTIAVFKGLEGILWSATHGFMSKLVEPEHHGALFSVISSVESLATIISNLLWPLTYSFTLLHDINPGMTFVFMGVLAAAIIPLLLSLFIFKPEEEKPIAQLRDKIETSYEQGDDDVNFTTNSNNRGEYKKLLSGSNWHYNTAAVN